MPPQQRISQIICCNHVRERGGMRRSSAGALFFAPAQVAAATTLGAIASANPHELFFRRVAESDPFSQTVSVFRAQTCRVWSQHQQPAAAPKHPLPSRSPSTVLYGRVCHVLMAPATW